MVDDRDIVVERHESPFLGDVHTLQATISEAKRALAAGWTLESIHCQRIDPVQCVAIARSVSAELAVTANSPTRALRMLLIAVAKECGADGDATIATCERGTRDTIGAR